MKVISIIYLVLVVLFFLIPAINQIGDFEEAIIYELDKLNLLEKHKTDRLLYIGTYANFVMKQYLVKTTIFAGVSFIFGLIVLMKSYKTKPRKSTK